MKADDGEENQTQITKGTVLLIQHLQYLFISHDFKTFSL